MDKPAPHREAPQEGTVSATKQALPPYFHLAAVRASVPFAALYPSMGESVEGTL